MDQPEATGSVRGVSLTPQLAALAGVAGVVVGAALLVVGGPAPGWGGSLMAWTGVVAAATGLVVLSSALVAMRRRSAAAAARSIRDAEITSESDRWHLVGGLIESIPEPVFVVERDPEVHLRIRAVNSAAVGSTGFTTADLVGEPVTRVIRDPAGAQGLLHRIERRGQLSGRETRLIAAAGDGREASLTATSIGSTAGGEPAWVIVVSDIGDARRAERRRVATSRVFEVAQAAETPGEMFRGVESVVRDSMQVHAFHIAGVDRATGRMTLAYCSDPTTPGVSVHEASRGLTGYALEREAAVILSAEQIRLLVERGDAKAAEPVAEHWASAPMRLGQGIRGVVVVQNRDRGSPYGSGDVDLLHFAAEQVAAWFRRRRGEEERQRLTAAVEQTADAVIVLDEKGGVEYANQAFERQTGWSRADALGRPLDQIWKIAERATPIAAIWKSVHAGKPWTGAVTCSRRDGSEFPVQATLSAVRDRDGRVMEHVVVQHDRSHEVELEEQFRHAQKMEAVGILAGGVAHDFNNLLSVIHGYAELARDGGAADSESASGAKACLEQVIDASRRATTLVAQLLAFSRRQVIDPRPIDVDEAVCGVQKMLGRLIGEHIELEIQTCGNLDLVEADPNKLDQVLMNLTVNARDAMPRGGRLTIATSMERVGDDDAARDVIGPGTWVVLSVRDSGVGIPPDVKSRIFEPFFTTKAPGQGTGLGLSTVYGIVTQANGHITVQSEIGRGTEFRIYLPSIGRTQAVAADVQPLDVSTGGQETVLVVEDEPALLGFVERILTHHGYQVVAARSGTEALELARARDGTIDLLLTDVVMPGMSGSSLAATIAEERRDIGTLYMSGYPDASIASYGVLDPDVDLVQKPFTSAQILKRVRHALEVRKRAMKSKRRPALLRR
ncbi:MAG: PAS domain S-box protein [Planctomycetes bacterium]|nr:PAS domain S-box protein [Planctomycetota bacterium]